MAVALLTVLLSSPAGALADSSPLVVPGRPNLTAAQAIGPSQVLACFDQILVTTFGFTDASFYLQGYAEGRRTGPAGGLVLGTKTSAGNGYCVVAAFTGAGDARSFSSLVVLANAVTASVPGGGGAGNPQAAVPLLGSVVPNTSGATLRPQLVGAAPSAAKTVSFTFNVPLTAAPGTQGFGFYASSDSTFHAGTVTGFTPGSAVSVTFADADAALLPQATRFVAGEGAVTDVNGRGNPLGTIGTGTQRLDLATTSGPLPAAGGLSYHFDFNGSLPGTAVVCPARYALYDAGGVRYSPAVGGTPTIAGDRRSTTLAFTPDTAGGDPAQITLATVGAGGVDATSCSGTAAPLNSDGAVALPGATAKVGSTSGPDLVGFQINTSTGFASFTFDAPVATTGIVPGGFHLVDRTGGLFGPPNQGGTGLLGQPPAGPEVNVGPANTVNVNFSVPTSVLGLLPGPPDVTAARSAIGVTVDEGAVSDAATSVVNPVGSLGSPAPTPTPIVPTVPSVPTVPKVPTVPVTPTPKPAVKAACKRVVTIHLLSSVSRNLRSATVTVDAKPVAVSKKLTVTIAFAKYPGVKSVVVRIRGRLKNHQAINRTKTYKNKC